MICIGGTLLLFTVDVVITSPVAFLVMIPFGMVLGIFWEEFLRGFLTISAPLPFPCPYLTGNDILAFPEGIHETAKIYYGTRFRPGIILVMKENTFIGNNCNILVPKLVMEKGSQICAGTTLAGKDPVYLCDNVVVGYHCVLLTSTDTPHGEFMNDASPEERRCIKRGRIELYPNVFIGSQSLIMPDVAIKKGIVVRRGSYVDTNLVQEFWKYQGTTPIEVRPDIKR